MYYTYLAQFQYDTQGIVAAYLPYTIGVYTGPAPIETIEKYIEQPSSHTIFEVS